MSDSTSVALALVMVAPLEVQADMSASPTNCSAWVAHASALLEQVEECAEHGYLLIPVAYQQPAIEGDPDSAAGTAAPAVEMGRRFGDPDRRVPEID